MKAKRVSEITMVQMAATTLEVVALPTASAPPWAFKPLLQAMSVTIQPNTRALMVLLRKVIGSMPSRSLTNPQNDYTKKLLASVPTIRRD